MNQLIPLIYEIVTGFNQVLPMSWYCTYIDFDLNLNFDVLTPLSAIFQLYHGTSFSGGRSRSTRREPPTMGKQLVNIIICDCKLIAPFFVVYKAGREPTRIGDRLE